MGTEVAQTESHELTTEHLEFLKQFSRETSRKMWRGELLKYVKGVYQIGKNEDETEIPLGTKVAAVIPSLHNGWLKWGGGKPVAYEMGEVIKGFKAPLRDALGDNEKATWEVDKDGIRRDPWQQNCLLIMIGEDETIYTFSTVSDGGRRAIGELTAEYVKHAHERPSQVPIISLGTDRYKHDQYGWVDFPVFKVVGWQEQAPFIAVLNGKGDSETSKPKATIKAMPSKKTKDGKGHKIRF